MKQRYQGDYVRMGELTDEQLKDFYLDCYACGANRPTIEKPKNPELIYMKWDCTGELDKFIEIVETDSRDVTDEYKQQPNNTQTPKLYIRDAITGRYLKAPKSFTGNREEAMEFSQEPSSVLVEHLQQQPTYVLVSVVEKTIRTEEVVEL